MHGNTKGSYNGKGNSKGQGKGSKGSSPSLNNYQDNAEFGEITDPRFKPTVELEDLIALEWVDVPGFEDQDVRIKVWKNKVPKTQSWCFVPLIASALGELPGFRFERKGKYQFSTPEQIEEAQLFWRNTFNHWDLWVESLREGIMRKFGEVGQCNIFHVRNVNWTTTMVFSKPREYGILPHPSGKWQEDLIDSCLDQKYQAELFGSIVAIGQYNGSN